MIKQEDKVYNLYKSKLVDFDKLLFEALSKNKAGHPSQFYARNNSVLSVREKTLSLNNIKLKTALISNFIYDDIEEAKALFEKVSRELDKENIINVVIPSSHEFDYSAYGYETAIEHYVYNFATNMLPSFSVEGIVLDPTVEQLMNMYNTFTSHFTGYFERTEKDFILLKDSVKSLKGSIASFQNQGYIVFIRYQSHIEVIELVYDGSATLLKLLSFASRGMRRIVYIASESEQIHKVLPEVTRTKEVFMLAKVSDVDLFERLFHIKILSAYSAFRAFAKPVFNRDFF